MSNGRKNCQESFEIESFAGLATWQPGFPSVANHQKCEMIVASQAVPVCDETVSLLGSQRFCVIA